MKPMFAKVRLRLLRTFRPDSLTWEELFRPSRVRRGVGPFEVGHRTYWFADSVFTAWKADDSITIGSYCSIAADAVLMAGGNHDVRAISTYPFTMIDRWRDWNAEPQPAQRLRIGNDVWIGARATVIGELNIGDGAVVAAGAVVVSDVPPYAVVGGVPARLMRFRFEPHEIETLLSLAWWEWPEATILQAEPILRSGDVRALQTFAAEHGLVQSRAPTIPTPSPT